MGYLSQKKHQIRQNIFLNAMILVLFCFTLLFIFYPDLNSKFFNFFHIYCLSIVLFFYSSLIKHFWHASFFGAVLAFNYTILAISCNIFLSNGFEGNRVCDVTFAPDELFSDTFQKDKIISSGTLIIAQKYISPYVILDEKVPLAFIRVDFRGAKRSEYAVIFKHLHEFILKQDVPVVILGEFGIPSWESSFRDFLDKSELSVKNRLLFTEGSRFNIFTLPSFYILGFKEMGIKDIDISQKNDEKIIKATLSFNLE